MLPRVLEPESMNTAEDVEEYDAMDHREVNARFVADFLAAHGACRGGEILDVGAGTARIPIALAGTDPKARITAVDLAPAMIERAERNVNEAGLSDRVRCLLADAKTLKTMLDALRFEAVISNSIIHHLADPKPALADMVDCVEPGGTLMIRDLARPDDEKTLGALVERYAGEESPRSRALFHDSLHAALTLSEIRAVAAGVGLPADSVSMTSDRHWTLIWKRPA